MFKRQVFNTDLEILYSNANLVSFSGTVLQGDAVADENGKKYILSGSFIDATGAVVEVAGTAGAETLTSTPVGVLYQTVEVTNGDDAGSLIVEGYLRADRVLAGIAAAAIVLIKEALPEVKFR